ncbi:MAG TPA: glycosyltransferase [Blastocatellia bacterium]|nr:glycosyltransferase [Blastocatellia bacterium]
MKKPHLWLSVLGLWLLAVVLGQRALLALLFEPLSIPGFISLVFFLAWINFAWLYGIYQLAATVFAAITPRLNPRHARPAPHESDIAVLYTTMNDFSEAAARSCVNLSYPQFHVFLLDDSTEPQERSRVDEFHRRFPHLTTVMRRPNLHGFKAGNLNHALELIADRYEFFVVCDADGVLPADFLGRAIAYFTNEQVGFVQARQRVVRSDRNTAFANELAASVEIYWQRIVPATQHFGFVIFHGHGGMIRTSVWQKVGGFPTVVAEDLAFSTRARQEGYVGLLADDLVCEEEFPSSYEAFARRQLKYTRGALEHLAKDMPAFLLSARITWVEKLDRLLASLAMVSAFPFFLFLMNFTLVLPFIFSAPSSRLGGPFARLMSVWGLLRIDTDQVPILTWPFIVMTVIALFGPLAPAACHLWKRPAELARYIATSIAIHLSLILSQFWEMLLLATTGRNAFPVTGDRAASQPSREERRAADRFRQNAPGLLGLAILFMAAIVSANVGVLPVCFALAAGVAINQWGWEHSLARITVLLPLTIIILLIIFATDTAIAASGSSIIAALSGF